MPAPCAPGRCAGVGGGDRAMTGALEIPQAPGAGRKAWKRGWGGTDPRQGEAKAGSRHTPLRARAVLAARVQRGGSLGFPCPAAARWVLGLTCASPGALRTADPGCRGGRGPGGGGPCPGLWWEGGPRPAPGG
jgi:hypothetical protein